MGVVYGSFLNSACPLLIAASAVVVCGVNWLDPSAAWPQAVQAKKSSTRPIVYIGSVYSNRFPSSQKSDCAPTNTACMQQGNSGPIPDAVKSGYARELRTQGLTVVESKPAQGIFYEVSVSARVYNFPSAPPVVPKRLVCDVSGQIIRHGTDRKVKALNVYEIDLRSLDGSAFSDNKDLADKMLLLDCLKGSAQTVRSGIRTMTES